MFEPQTRKNFLYYLIFHIARYAFPLIVTPFLARFLMKDGFGEYAIINSCVWSTSIFMEFGFYLYGINRIAQADSISQISRDASAIVTSKILLIPVCLIAYSILIVVSGMWVRAPVSSAIGILTLLGVGGSFSWYFQGRQRGATAVMIEGVPQLAQLVLFLLLIRSPKDLWLVILLQALTVLAALVLSVSIAYRDGLRLRIGLGGVREALHGAKPFFVERVCYSFYTALTPTIVAMLAGVQEAATFSLAGRVNLFLGTLALPVSQTMVPVLSKVAKDDQHSWKMPLIVTSSTLLFCGAAALFVYFTIGFIIREFFSQPYEAAIGPAQIFCAASFVGSVSLTVANFIIIPRGASNILIWSALVALCVSVLLQFWLIPTYGAAGGAISRLGADLVTAIILSIRAVMLFRSRDRRRPEESAGPEQPAAASSSQANWKVS